MTQNVNKPIKIITINGKQNRKRSNESMLSPMKYASLNAFGGSCVLPIGFPHYNLNILFHKISVEKNTYNQT